MQEPASRAASAKEVGPLSGDPNYEIAAAYTAACNLSDDPPSIPLSALVGKVPVPFPDSIGCQPLGISPHPTTPDRFILADYDGPGLVIFDAVVTSEGRFELRVVRWIRWTVLPDSQQANPGSTDVASIRLFPIDPRSDTKRAQCAIWSRDGERLIYGRNGETGGPLKRCDSGGRILATSPGGLWVATTYQPNPPWLQMAENPIQLEGSNLGNIEGMAMDPDQDVVFVLRSNQNGDPAWLTTYTVDGQMVETPEFTKPPSLPWLYGPGLFKNEIYYVTDRRLPLQDGQDVRGIYRGNTLVVPGVTGNGIAFREDGSALVTQYNAGFGSMGKGGRILFVPAACFNH